MRSGIVLAGANTIGQKETAGVEDGWVTAEEVALLNLRGTELVVLSACDTGLGQVQVGEGVYGLRRAFVLAGARTLVMSLWKVPDEATQELMVRFYTHLLAGKECLQLFGDHAVQHGLFRLARNILERSVGYGAVKGRRSTNSSRRRINDFRNPFSRKSRFSEINRPTLSAILPTSSLVASVPVLRAWMVSATSKTQPPDRSLGRSTGLRSVSS